jgi:hypothetical protein
LAAGHEASPEQAGQGVLDKWLIWGIALCAIVGPAFLLILISSMQSHTFVDLTDCRAAAGRGEFLIPDGLLLVECCRRLIREVRPENKVWRAFKVVVVLICAVMAAACLAASIVLATDRTANTAESAIDLTAWCLGIGFLMGTIAVAVRDGEA